MANLIGALDIVPGSRSSTAELLHHPTVNETLRVFYLSHATAPQTLQRIVNAIRTMAGVSRAFGVAGGAIAVRGTTNDIATADWLIQSLDLPPDAKAETREFHVPGSSDVILFCQFNPKTGYPGLRNVLSELRAGQFALKMAGMDAPKILVFRGPPDQIAQTEQFLN